MNSLFSHTQNKVSFSLLVKLGLKLIVSNRCNDSEFPSFDLKTSPKGIFNVIILIAACHTCRNIKQKLIRFGLI